MSSQHSENVKIILYDREVYHFTRTKIIINYINIYVSRKTHSNLQLIKYNRSYISSTLPSS
jgi:hypothetical protein